MSQKNLHVSRTVSHDSPERTRLHPRHISEESCHVLEFWRWATPSTCTAHQTFELLQTDSKKIAGVRAGLAAAAAATDGPGKCGAVQTYMIKAYTCLAKSCLLYSTFRLDVTVDNLWIRPPKRKGLDFDYWTGLGRIDVDCTDCLPVAGISPQVGIIKLSQPCVRVLEQASD
jgi:hypothetical protein